MTDLEEKINFIKDNKDYSTDMPIWKLVLLLTLTLGFYDIYWAFKNIRLLKFLKKTSITPWTSLFFGIPVVPYFLFYKILCLNNSNKFKNHIYTLFLISIFYYFLTYGYKAPPICLLVFLTFIPEVVIQKELNKYFQNNKI